MNTVQTSIRAYLDEHEYLAYRISGVSMLPMLRQEKDLVTLRRYDGKGLKKYDVAMYDRGGPRRYVLHRVVEVGDGSYTFLTNYDEELQTGTLLYWDGYSEHKPVLVSRNAAGTKKGTYE